MSSAQKGKSKTQKCSGTRQNTAATAKIAAPAPSGTKSELQAHVLRDLNRLGTDLARRAVGVITDLVRQIEALECELLDVQERYEE